MILESILNIEKVLSDTEARMEFNFKMQTVIQSAEKELIVSLYTIMNDYGFKFKKGTQLYGMKHNLYEAGEINSKDKDKLISDINKIYKSIATKYNKKFKTVANYNHTWFDVDYNKLTSSLRLVYNPLIYDKDVEQILPFSSVVLISSMNDKISLQLKLPHGYNALVKYSNK